LQEAPKAPVSNGSGNYVNVDSGFSITKISFGAILAPLGVGLLVYGFGAYTQLLPGVDISSLLLIYGFPISILGAALNYAQVAACTFLLRIAGADNFQNCSLSLSPARPLRQPLT
jgi:hypothetical protein